MTALAAPDPHDCRRATVAAGLLRDLADATILDAADVHAALNLTGLTGSGDGAGAGDDVVDRGDDGVRLAIALAVRAVRLGHVYVDLATVAGTVVPDDEGVAVDLGAFTWPEPTGWARSVAASSLTALGEDGPADRPLRLFGTRLYLDRYWRHERTVVSALRHRANDAPPHVDGVALARGLGRLFPGSVVDEDQRRAAATAVEQRLSVIAGGPGTGKTTTVARIVALLHEQAVAVGEPPPRVALAAPTGKAAARLAEAVHAAAATLDTDPRVREALLQTTASTLHRLLGWQPGNRSRFRHNATNPLPHNLVIVDESSMIGLSMMAKLLEAVRLTARLVLVGDPRQLVSVEAGAVLGDIVRSPLPGIVELRRVYRYGGGVALLAQAIESGDVEAVLGVLRASPDGVTWLDLDPAASPSHSPELARVRSDITSAARAVVAAARRGDGVAALAALRSIQVLCAHRRGPAGAAVWRAEIERWLRSAIPGYGRGALARRAAVARH